MKKALLITPILALTLAGCGISTQDGGTSPPPANIGDWAEYSPQPGEEPGEWKSDSAWGNPPKKDSEVTSSPLPDIETEQPAPVLSRPRFAPAENAEFKAPPTVRPEDAVTVNRVAETSTLRPVQSPKTVEVSPPPTVSVPAIITPAPAPVRSEPTPTPPPEPKTENKPSNTQVPEIVAPVVQPPKVAPVEAVAIPAVLPGPKVIQGSEVLPPKENAPPVFADPQEAIAVAMEVAPEPDERITSSWATHVLDPQMRADFDQAVLGALKTGSSELVAWDKKTKFWVEKKGVRNGCQVFEVMRGGVEKSAPITGRGEAVFCKK